MTEWTSLLEEGLDPAAVASIVDRALAEDLGGGHVSDEVDVTSAATIPEDAFGTVDVRTRAAGVVAGIDVAALVFERADAEVLRVAADGDRVQPGDVVLTATGPLRRMLTVERTMLNLLCHLSGIATLTARWVDAVAGTGAQIRDTRKTTPGLRALEKYAVRCGGGVNHRMGLWDAALIKDNHVAAAGGIAAAFEAVRGRFPHVTVEVECDTIAQVNEAIAGGADLVLLDNMTIADLRACVEVAPPHLLLEASGGLTLDTARAVADTGVHFLAVGALTHSAPILDLGMDLRSDPVAP
jgi:nicotinate-nucleotide pyrophosphorylase (carboxylating)